MKNIHLLPTENPSRLFKFANELHLDTISKDYYKKYNIYITSDEEIKEGDWCYDEYNKVVFKNTCAGTPGASKKIILTTDQDLIADGVQAIDNEFLEWFVKNPSCNNVEVKTVRTKYFGNISYIYKIIIPEEESKQEGYICPHTKTQCDDECCVSAEDCHIVSSLATGMVDCDESKQETVEEAAVKYAVSVNAKMGSHKGAYENCSRLDFIAGTKWESERGYNEQIALINWLQQSLTAKKFYSTDAEDLIEQFKRK
jgi:hypothetical protein